MKNLLSYVYVPKKLITALVSVFAVASIGTVAFAGFAPVNRDTFTWANPSDYITFNSITDNPTVGDERAFLEGAVTTASSWSDPVNGVQDGDTVALKLYFHNDAADSLGLIAEDTKVRIDLPSGNATSHVVTGYVNSPDAIPVEVSDTLNVSSFGNKDFTMTYIPGSAKMVNNVFKAPNGITLPDSIVTTGALVGYDSLNGDVPGCDQYSGWVYLKVRISVPNPQYSCDLLTVTSLGNRQIQADVNTTAKDGATLSTITYNFGDSSANLVTTDTSVTYTYAQDGAYTVQAIPSFTIGAQTFTDPSANCVKQVNFNGELPNTGPGSLLSVFVATTVLGALAYRLRTIRKLNR